MTCISTLTKADVLATIRALGLHVRCVDGEYRVTRKDVSAETAERIAHYTTDREDAVDTARAMAALANTPSTTPLADKAYETLSDAQDLFVPISDELSAAREAFKRSRSQRRAKRYEAASVAFDVALGEINKLHELFAAAQDADAANYSAQLKAEAAARSPSFAF